MRRLEVERHSGGPGGVTPCRVSGVIEQGVQPVEELD